MASTGKSFIASENAVSQKMKATNPNLTKRLNVFYDTFLTILKWQSEICNKEEKEKKLKDE